MLLITVSSFAGIGINNSYSIISQNEYNKILSKRKPVIYNRYLVIPDYCNNYKEIQKIKDQDTLLFTFSYMLKKNKSSYIEKYISQCDTATDINLLLCGLYYFSKMDYFKSLSYIEKFENKKYEFLKYLIIADCKYELHDNKKNYSSIISAYQVAFDITGLEQNKTIVKNRIKYIKYK